MVKNRNVQYSELVISQDSTVREALSRIDRHGIGDVFVVDDAGRLLGVIGEDEIRRAILGGASLSAPVRPLLTKPAATANPTDDRAAVLDLMHALKLREVPVVDQDGRILGIHAKDEVIGAVELENWAVVMAGGLGTRLAPLTKNIPKPMLPVAGRPILERLVLHLVGSGTRKIFLSVNYLADIVEKHFGDGSQFGCTIEYLREATSRPLGTGGALRLLSDLGYQPDRPILVMNGDLITSFSVSDLLASHLTQERVATIAVSEYRHQVPFGVLESVGGDLVRIVEKPTSAWAVNAGIYVLDPRLLPRIPANENFPITRLFDDCLTRGERVGLWSMKENWQDIGRPDELAQARGEA
jgi:dTDP-glucose pyrophosphorylase